MPGRPTARSSPSPPSRSRTHAWSTNTDIWTVPADGRRAQEPHRGQPGRRRPAGLLARRHDGSPTSARPGRGSSRTSGCSRACEARRQRDDRRQLVPRPARAVVRLAERRPRWPPSSTARGPSRSSRSESSSSPTDRRRPGSTGPAAGHRRGQQLAVDRARGRRRWPSSTTPPTSPARSTSGRRASPSLTQL